MAPALQTLVLLADARHERPTWETKPPPRLLIVDDEEAVRKMFTRLLRAEGFDVRAVATAGAGLDAVAEWRPDAILLDYRMPLVNGVGFLYRLRARESSSRTPVAVITGAGEVEGALAKEFATLGAAVFFKPLGRDGLRNVARMLLKIVGDVQQRSIAAASGIATGELRQALPGPLRSTAAAALLAVWLA
jgi:DNA-binding response OmpR family regulator